ncbi:RDD family protein [Dictyobacter kobayashii]|uniref:RDD domain-containing protein n=1 Tax=Dictyobacter kobayashii TaxID=2014872 RepID=A0A402AXT6_9CHLR|nr:RDD family protein [Dictyobacter kobayashii]GCE23907.1 hypothetical protein KDK_77070 [Dictyobacter kobayashii]
MLTDGVVGTKQGISRVRTRIFFMRVAAAIIDLIILSCLQIWASGIFGIVDPTSSADQYLFDGDGIPSTMSRAAVINPVWLYLIVFVYFFVQEALFGTTIGKLFLGLQVTGLRGERVTFPASLARNLWRFIDMLPLVYLAGFFSCLLSPTFQRIGDRFAHTMVLPIKATPAASYPGPTLLKRYAVLCIIVVAIVGFCLNYMYYYRPPLVVQGWVNINNSYQFHPPNTVPPCGKVSSSSGDIVINRNIHLLQTKAPTWSNSDTVTYPIDYADKVTCSANVTLHWNGILDGWSVSGVEINS